MYEQQVPLADAAGYGFSQDTISPTFRDVKYGSVVDLAKNIVFGDRTLEELTPIKYMTSLSGLKKSCDNRRLCSFKLVDSLPEKIKEELGLNDLKVRVTPATCPRDGRSEADYGQMQTLVRKLRKTCPDGMKDDFLREVKSVMEARGRKGTETKKMWRLVESRDQDTKASNLRKHTSELEAHAEEHRKAVETLNLEATNLRTHIRELEARVAQGQRESQDLLSRAQKNTAALAQKVTDLEARLEASKKTYGEIDQRLRSCHQNLQNCGKNLNDCRSRTDELLRDLQKKKGDTFQQRSSDAAKRLSLLEERNNFLTQKLMESEDKVLKLQGALLRSGAYAHH